MAISPGVEGYLAKEGLPSQDVCLGGGDVQRFVLGLGLGLGLGGDVVAPLSSPLLLPLPGRRGWQSIPAHGYG